MNYHIVKEHIENAHREGRSSNDAKIARAIVHLCDAVEAIAREVRQLSELVKPAPRTGQGDRGGGQTF